MATNDDRKEEKPKNPGGRPTKFTPDTCARILENIRMCMPFELACKAAGVSYAAFRIWVRKGEEQRSGKFRKFFEDVQKAESDAMAGNLATILMGVKKGDWRAAAWILERRHADFFSKTRIELGATTGATSFEALMHELQEIEERKAMEAAAVENGGGDAKHDEVKPPAPADQVDEEEDPDDDDHAEEDQR